MNTTSKPKNVKGYNVDKELAKVKRLFKRIERDKTLPTFLNFFLECLIMGTAENVNLKKMYPKVYKNLNTFLGSNKAKILATRK
jgi:hypothetical protein